MLHTCVCTSPHNRETSKPEPWFRVSPQMNVKSYTDLAEILAPCTRHHYRDRSTLQMVMCSLCRGCCINHNTNDLQIPHGLAVGWFW